MPNHRSFTAPPLHNDTYRRAVMSIEYDGETSANVGIAIANPEDNFSRPRGQRLADQRLEDRPMAVQITPDNVTVTAQYGNYSVTVPYTSARGRYRALEAASYAAFTWTRLSAHLRKRYASLDNFFASEVEPYYTFS